MGVRQKLRVIPGTELKLRLAVLRNRFDTCCVCATASRKPSKITFAESDDGWTVTRLS